MNTKSIIRKLKYDKDGERRNTKKVVLDNVWIVPILMLLVWFGNSIRKSAVDGSLLNILDMSVSSMTGTGNIYINSAIAGMIFVLILIIIWLIVDIVRFSRRDDY